MSKNKSDINSATASVENFRKLQASYNYYKSEFQKAQATFDSAEPPENEVRRREEMREMQNIMFNIADNLFREIQFVFDELINYKIQHLKGHTPKLLTSSAVEKFLDTVGQSNDFEVLKPTIFVQANTKK